MTAWPPKKIASFLLLLTAIAGFAGAYSIQYRAEHAGETRLAALLSAPASPLRLDPPTRTSPCRVNGALPDHACTPGAVFPDAAESIICVLGYTKTVRSVPVSVKKKIYAAYGLAYPQPAGSYEIDHLIPLELGGSNDTANLFPEAASPAPGFREKDLVENYLHQEVCAGRVALSTAQRQIAEDWKTVYDNLSPAEIKNLKAAFASWADKN